MAIMIVEKNTCTTLGQWMKKIWVFFSVHMHFLIIIHFKIYDGDFLGIFFFNSLKIKFILIKLNMRVKAVVLNQGARAHSKF